MFLFESSLKIVLFLVAIGGLVAWLTLSESDPLKALEERCAGLQLPIRTIKLEPGSNEENKFLLMVPARQRERLQDDRWVFCRANLAIRTR